MHRLKPVLFLIAVLLASHAQAQGYVEAPRVVAALAQTFATYSSLQSDTQPSQRSNRHTFVPAIQSALNSGIGFYIAEGGSHEHSELVEHRDSRSCEPVCSPDTDTSFLTAAHVVIRGV